MGLADVVTQQVPHLGELRDQTYTGKTIGVSYIPAKWQSKYSQPACGIKRTTLNLTMKNALIDADIEVHEGWKLKTILEKEDSVVAISEDGKRMEGSILIGCDGIKAMSRALLLKEHQIQPEGATYTGLTQVEPPLLRFLLTGANIMTDCRNVPYTTIVAEAPWSSQPVRPWGTSHLLSSYCYHDIVGYYKKRLDRSKGNMENMLPS